MKIPIENKSVIVSPAAGGTGVTMPRRIGPVVKLPRQAITLKPGKTPKK